MFLARFAGHIWINSSPSEHDWCLEIFHLFSGKKLLQSFLSHESDESVCMWKQIGFKYSILKVLPFWKTLTMTWHYITDDVCRKFWCHPIRSYIIFVGALKAWEYCIPFWFLECKFDNKKINVLNTDFLALNAG